MRTTSPITSLAFLMAAFAVQCSSNGSSSANGSDAGANGTMEHTTVRAADGSTVNADGAPTNGTTQGSGTASNGRKSSSALSLLEERTNAASDMRSLRATLMADLDAVRARLNMGNDPQRDADQKIAADLAQGLERVDRALTAMDSANDSTWVAMRGTQLKEVDDVRVWLDQYKGSATANK